MPRITGALSRHMLLAFALPSIMLGFILGPEAQVQGIYAKYSGLSLNALAGAVLLTRIFDAITYPLIGSWSDSSFQKSGTRKRWMVGGTLTAVIGLWFLFRPPQHITVAYFTVWTAVTYVGWKLTDIPYTAWSVNLTRDYVQRSRIQLWRGMAMTIGSLLFFAAPFTFKLLGVTPSTEFNLQMLSSIAVLVVACVPLLNLYAVIVVPDGDAPPPQAKSARTADIRTLWRALAGNAPLQRLLCALAPAVFVLGMSTGVSFLYVDVYMHLGKYLPLILLVSTPFSLLGMLFWGWVSRRIERHKVWSISTVLAALAFGGIGFAPVGEAGLYVILVLYPLTLFCISSIDITVSALMGDAVDYGRWQTGTDRAGIFAAIIAFLRKSIVGAAAALGMASVGWLGFSVTAAQQTPMGALAIKLVMLWLPVVGLVASAIIIWSFPITRARQIAIRSELELREAQASENSRVTPGYTRTAAAAEQAL